MWDCKTFLKLFPGAFNRLNTYRQKMDILMLKYECKMLNSLPQRCSRKALARCLTPPEAQGIGWVILPRHEVSRPGPAWMSPDLKGRVTQGWLMAAPPRGIPQPGEWQASFEACRGLWKNTVWIRAAAKFTALMFVFFVWFEKFWENQVRLESRVQRS